MRQIVTHDTLLSYLDLNKRNNIHIDSRNLQLGAVMSQYGNPTTFYLRKPACLQMRYMLTEKKLINKVEKLKYFRNILLIQQRKIITEHKFLTCYNFNTS